jgi:glycosyltransferase involved in cell wall biosynthesis
MPNRESASLVIPNWNGRDLLQKYLPSVVTAMSGNPANEVIVVDNASTDGSADFIKQSFRRSE